MNNLQIFRSADFGSIRTIEQDGKVLFCGRDVAAALGYANTKDALSKHCKSDGVAFRYPIRDSVDTRRKHTSSRKAMFIGSLPTAACPLRNSLNGGCSTKFCRRSGARAVTRCRSSTPSRLPTFRCSRRA